MHGENRKELLQRWLKAAHIFCNSRTPNFGKFADVSADICRDYYWPREAPTHSSSWLIAGLRMAQDIVKATPHRGRDRLDTALYTCDDFVEFSLRCAEHLAAVCVKEELLTPTEEDQLTTAISETLKRREVQLSKRRVTGLRP